MAGIEIGCLLFCLVAMSLRAILTIERGQLKRGLQLTDSATLERNCGLVFTELTDNLHWLWPGYWEWHAETLSTNPRAPGRLVTSTAWYVRPEGSSEDKWVMVKPNLEYDEAARLLDEDPACLGGSCRSSPIGDHVLKHGDPMCVYCGFQFLLIQE